MRWLAAVTLLGFSTFACGRVGYELLPVGGGFGGSGAGAEASTGGGAGRDASMVVPPTGGSSGTGGALGAGSALGSGGVRGSRDASPDAPVSQCAIKPVADYCLELPQLAAPAVIDGELDCGLALHPLTPVGWTGGAMPPDATAEYAVAWRFDGLYFYVSVHDPLVVPAPPALDIWEGDGIELFVDNDGTYASPPGYDSIGTRQFVTAAPPSASASIARGQIWAYPIPVGSGLPAVWRSTIYRTFPKPGGYVLEAFVVGADLGLASWSLAAGARVGMDLSIDVSYPEADASGAFGHRLGQYSLSVGPTPSDGGIASPYFDTFAFCNPSLVAR
jgi:hypothetical protein